MFIQKKNGVWWLRENLDQQKPRLKPARKHKQNIGQDYKVARKIVIEEMVTK